MTHSATSHELARADGQTGPFPVMDGVPPALDLAFDAGALDLLRARVRAQACQAGMPEDRIADVVLAVHELAGNAVRHGPGRGRLRIWTVPGALHCAIDDGDPPSAGDQVIPNSWPIEPMHGLWLVRRVADQTHTWSGPGGTRASATFNLPS